MKAQASLFDRDLDKKVNHAKVAELRQYGIPVGWIAVSPVECQALLADVVSDAIKEQARTVLKPGVEEEQWFG